MFFFMLKKPTVGRETLRVNDKYFGVREETLSQHFETNKINVWERTNLIRCLISSHVPITKWNTQKMLYDHKKEVI